MRRRQRHWFENIDTPTIYSSDQYQQLRTTPGSPDEAADRLDVSKTEIRELCTRLEAGAEVAEDSIQLYRKPMMLKKRGRISPRNVRSKRRAPTTSMFITFHSPIERELVKWRIQWVK